MAPPTKGLQIGQIVRLAAIRLRRDVIHLQPPCPPTKLAPPPVTIQGGTAGDRLPTVQGVVVAGHVNKPTALAGTLSGIIRKAVAAIPLLVVFVVIAANFGWFFGSPLHMVLFWVLAAAAWWAFLRLK